ncbi:MAG: carbohydrate binding family 9 domain-containing protein [Gemmatimonadota bacterium]|nr:MAG: carbohydrate binding family 9 domain-containing protein [Gemmatimonadota bacterium]
MDGRLEDVAWGPAPLHSSFVQRDPDQGRPPTERTEFRVVYSDEALYVGVRAWDSRPGEISAQLTRRDEYSPSDRIVIAIDSYRDRRTAFVFAVNPAGVKQDWYSFDDADEDDTWNAVWDVECTIDSLGWIAEFRIPFSQLRFTTAEEQVFGFQVVRNLNRLNEETHWQLMRREEPGVVSLFGDLEGIRGIAPPRRAEFMPYLSATGLWNEKIAGDPFNTGRDRDLRAGLDLNVGVTSNISFSATVNPDFGQVEADPAVVNLTAFETFFPEKRPFFSEGLDMFLFRLMDMEQLFYTRRIGRAPQGVPDPRGGFAQNPTETTIYTAAKLSGKTAGGWTVGLLDALTAEERAQVVDSAGNTYGDPVEPLTNYFAGRLAKDFRQGLTRVGAFATAVNRRLPANLEWLRTSAYSLGLDFSHRWSNDAWGVSATLVGSHVRGSQEAIDLTQKASARYYQRPDNDHVDYDPTRTSLSGVAGDFIIEKRTGSWRGAIGFDTRSPGFEVNDAGFMRRSDRIGQALWIQRRWLDPGKLFRRAAVNFEQHSVFTYGWERTGLDASARASLDFLNYWHAYLGVEWNAENLDPGSLRGGPAFLRPPTLSSWCGFSTDSRKSLRAAIEGAVLRQPETRSWAYEVSIRLSWRAASNLDLTLAPRLLRNYDSWQYLQTSTVADSSHYIFGELNLTTASMTIRANITFTPNMSLQLYAEPFISTGEYLGLRDVLDPKAPRFDGRFRNFSDDDLIVIDEEIWIDVDGDGAGDINIVQPNFRAISFRSNVVLRWEYILGSTLFLVWQHGRSDVNDNSQFQLWDGIQGMFRLPAENLFVLKVNYWLSL